MSKVLLRSLRSVEEDLPLRPGPVELLNSRVVPHITDLLRRYVLLILLAELQNHLILAGNLAVSSGVTDMESNRTVWPVPPDLTPWREVETITDLVENRFVGLCHDIVYKDAV